MTIIETAKMNGTNASVVGFKLVARRSIVVVAAHQGLRQSVAFALDVEGYSTESYDSLRKAEASCREALCAILDNDILRSEPQAAAQFLSNRGGRAILLVDGLSALQQRVDNTTLTKRSPVPTCSARSTA